MLTLLTYTPGLLMPGVFLLLMIIIPFFPFKYLYLLLPSHISLHWLELSVQCWIGMVRRDILTLVWQHLSSHYKVWCFTCISFQMLYMKLRKCLSVSSLLRIFMMNGCWILSDDFFSFICWSHLVIIFLRLLLLWFMITDFQMLHIWNASYLDIVCNSFYGLLGFFSYILLGILLLCSWEVFVFNFFLLISSSDFDIWV